MTGFFRRGAFVLTALSASVMFQAPIHAETRPIRFNQLSLEHGLSQSTVLCMFQDSRGFIWIGTEDGLNRYDGFKFTIYKHDPSDVESLGHDAVWGIDEDDSGNLWLATSGGGLAMWDRARDAFVRYGADEGLSSPYIRAVHAGRNGFVWAGTRDAGLNRVDPATGAIKQYRANTEDSANLSDDHVFALYTDQAGNLWVGTDAGLNRFDLAVDGFIVYGHDASVPSSLSDGRVRAIFEDGDGALWVGTYGGGLNRLDRSSGRFLSFRHDPTDASSLSHDRVRAILEDDAGRLWIGTSGGLDLLESSRNGFAHYRHDSSKPTTLSDNHVMSLFQDRGGVLWVGTRTGGLNKWNPLIWQFGHRAADGSGSDGLSNNNVMSFSEDRDGRLWMATFGGGLNVMDRATGKFVHHRHDPKNQKSLSSNRVTALLHDHRGTLWVGTLDGGLNRFNPRKKTFTSYRHDDERSESLGADGVTSIVEDTVGNLWIGTFGGGLDRLDRNTGRFTHYRQDPDDPAGLSGDRVTCVAEDGRGRLWIGTDGGGLTRLDPALGRSVHFRYDPDRPSSLSADTVFSLHIDAAGTLWIGTRGGGLDVLPQAAEASDSVSFRNYSEREGLPNEVIYGIQSDSAGNVWLSTNNGLSRFDPSHEAFRNYDVNDGLQSNEFHFGSSYRSPGGELFFGGVNGFNAFLPDQLKHNRHVPPVVLTSFLKFNKPTSEAGPATEIQAIDLDYDDDVVTFEFAALDYSAPGNNRYAYMLEGFEEEWNDVGAVHRVTYTNLDPGSYVFRVRAANNDGVWNENGLSVGLDVATPPWRTAWAYAAYLLIFGAAVMTFVRAQQRKLEREASYSRRLEQDVKARTMELAERATELEVLNRKLITASVTDSLTGLANRRYLLQYLDKEVSLIRRREANDKTGTRGDNSVELVFMMVDLDNFKTINDTCGHTAGDRVLQQLKAILEGACRKSDILIRWGGDELLVVGRDSDPNRLSALAERIRSRVANHVFELEGGQVVSTTCTIGFACYPFIRSHFDALSWEQVVSVADRALYLAKRSGRNAWAGFVATAETPFRGLLGTVLHCPKELVEGGQLEVRSSITGDLVWESPEPHQVSVRVPSRETPEEESAEVETPA